MSRYKVVYIHWIDPCHGKNGWLNPEDEFEDLCKISDAGIHTAGILYKQTKDKVFIVQAIALEADAIFAPIIILKKNIIRIEHLKDIKIEHEEISN